jgi:hypothetical protein
MARPTRSLIAVIAGIALAAVALWRAAGRDRRRRLAGVAGRAGRSVPVSETAGFVGDKATAVWRLLLEWLRAMAGAALGWRNSEEAAEAIAVDLAGELAQAINDHARQMGDPPPGLTDRPSFERQAHARRRGRTLAQASSR